MFVLNYFDQGKFGSFALSLIWSCCVDLHVGLAFIVLTALVKWSIPLASKDEIYLNSQDLTYRVRLALRMRWLFLALVIGSVILRGLLFEKDSLNLFKLGQYSHFGSLMTPGSYAWIRDYYRHEWRTSNSAAEFAIFYINYMYSRTHTRFGPFAVGGVLACNYYLANWRITLPTVSGKIVSWILTLLSIVQLVIPCLPAADEAPLEAQLIATAALRVLAASSMVSEPLNYVNFLASFSHM